MKWLITAAVAVAVTPMLAIGTLIAAYAATSQPGCSHSATAPAKATRSGCGAAADIVRAVPFTGPDSYVDDPTSRGRITRRMLHTYDEGQRAFGGWKWGIGCWDPRTWNPNSDHPRGRACDFAVGTIGHLPTPAQRAVGWQLAHWLQANAAALGIAYMIWDGRIWSPSRVSEGWRRYTGGGIYNPNSITGGHHDHVHCSVQ